MTKTLAAAAALSLFLVGGAAADPRPSPSLPGLQLAQAGGGQAVQTADQCIAYAAELGAQAESKSLPEDTLDKLEELFTRLETLCEEEKFDEAMAVADDIRSAIESQ